MKLGLGKTLLLMYLIKWILGKPGSHCFLQAMMDSRECLPGI